MLNNSALEQVLLSIISLDLEYDKGYDSGKVREILLKDEQRLKADSGKSALMTCNHGH